MGRGDKRLRRRRRLAITLPIVFIAALLLILPLSATGQLGVLNDLLSLGHAGGQTPAPSATQHNSEPPLTATPRANCLPGSRREPGIQGRVPNGAGSKGLHCNVSLVSHQGTSGGFKVHRYTDPKGHECGFYDTALLFPTNALKLSGTSQGVAALDMSNPARPRQTATLREIPMNSPHESLALNSKRGLLAAVMGNPATAPGLVSIYDVRSDCRHPRLQSTRPVARLGHESGFSADGRTFYATGTAVNAISAIDVTNPKDPHSIWQGNITSHGMSLSPDGNRAYLADPGGELAILDTSQIQARRSNPQTREISRLGWKSASIPQNAIPFTVRGRPYLMETDEYTAGHVRRRQQGRGRRRAHHRHLRRDAIRAWSRTCACRSTSPTTTRPPRMTPERSARSRATRATTATCPRPWTRSSSPARSSSPGCACSTSAG